MAAISDFSNWLSRISIGKIGQDDVTIWRANRRRPDAAAAGISLLALLFMVAGITPAKAQATEQSLLALQKSIAAQQARLEQEEAQLEQQALQLQQQSYTVGTTTVLNLIAAQRTYAQARLGYVSAEVQQFEDSAGLLVAMGGGWWNDRLEASAR